MDKMDAKRLCTKMRLLEDCKWEIVKEWVDDRSKGWQKRGGLVSESTAGRIKEDKEWMGGRVVSQNETKTIEILSGGEMKSR